MSDIARNAKTANDNLEAVTKATGRTRAAMQSAGFQAQDFFVQVAGGTPVIRALSQQLPQLVGSLQMMGGGAEGAKGKFAQFASFLGGPWGVAIGVAIPVIGMFAEHLFSAGKAADDTRGRIDALTRSAGDLASAMGKATVAQMVNAQGELNTARLTLQALEKKPGITRSGKRTDEDLAKMAQLRSEISSLEATIAGVEIARKKQAVYDAEIEKAAQAARAARAGARDARKEEREAQRDAEKAAAQAQHMEDVRTAWLADQERKISEDIAKNIDALAKQGLTIAEWGTKLGEEWQQIGADQKRINQENLNIFLDQLRTLEAMEGPAGDVARILRGLTTGDFAGVGGRLGGFARALTNIVPKNAWKPLIDAMQGIFGKGGDLQKSISRMLQGASLGNAAGSLALGKKNSELGASIGGALGEKVGEKLFKKLGDFAGPLGSIVGGLLGGALGGLLTKTQWGRVDLTAKGASAGVGNDKTSIGAAVQAGGAFFKQLRQIADAFGGTIGDFGSISIGQRHGDWRVNTGGTSLKVKKGAIDFNDDAEAAIAFAIQTAIERGAIDGIRASTQNLLRSGSDLQEKLDKALQFEGVFTELKKRSDPAAFAIEELGRQGERLRKIFDEAGASAAEYAQLEQLLAMQRADIETENLNKQRALEVQLLEAQGKATEALALQRTIELSTTEDWLKALQQQVYAAQDAAQAQADLAQALEQAGAKFRGFASDLKSFRDSLGGGDTLVMSYRQAMTKLLSTGSLAIAGDETALGALSGVGRDFLTAAKENASSLAQYQRDVAMLTRYVDDAIATAEYLAGNPPMSSGSGAGASGAGGTATGQTSMAQMMADWRAELAGMRAEQKSIGESIALTNSKMATIFARVEKGGALTVVSDEDAPLHTVTP